MRDFVARQFGVINSAGRLMVYNNEIFEEHCARSPSTDVEVIVLKKDGLIDHGLRSYYFGVVLKEFQRGLHYAGSDWSLEKTDDFLRGLGFYEETIDEQTGEFTRRTLSLSEAGKEAYRSQFWHFIKFCIRVSVEYLNHPIPLPNENLVNS